MTFISCFFDLLPCSPFPPLSQGILVTPEEGFVIKTQQTTVADPRKVFINITQSAEVGKPAPKTKLDADGTEQTVCVHRFTCYRVRIPVLR